jgi:hypothetical protein
MRSCLKAERVEGMADTVRCLQKDLAQTTVPRKIKRRELKNHNGHFYDSLSLSLSLSFSFSLYIYICIYTYTYMCTDILI